MIEGAAHRLAESTRGIQLAPDSADAWYNLGKALNDLGRYGEAALAYQRASDLNPGDAEIWFNLGNVLLRGGRSGDAIAAYQRGISCNPLMIGLHQNLGRALASAGRFKEAIDAFREAIRMNPRSADAHINLGELLTRCGRYGEALEACMVACELAPDSADASYNVGVLLALRDEWSGAERWLVRALQLRPAFAEALVNLAEVLRAQGRTGDAIRTLRSAVALRPEMAEAHYNLALALLQSGEYEEGWMEFAWRHATAEGKAVAPSPGLPSWDGSFRENMTLLVQEEQGYGDTLHTARYLPLLAARGVRVILECRKELHPLFRESKELAGVFFPGEKTHYADAATSMFSLPYFLGTTLATIPAHVPYLHAPAGAALRWRPRVRIDGSTVHIGIVWAGNPLHRNDRRRSIPAVELLPLLRTPGVHWHSILTGPQSGDAGYFPPDIEIRYHGGQITDFGESAALLEQLDLLISVDTAAAHLGGALAVPVWLLLPFNPDWRWMSDREDSPWYPTMRLFRQPLPGAWGSVVASARDALTVFVEEHAEGSRTA